MNALLAPRRAVSLEGLWFPPCKPRSDQKNEELKPGATNRLPRKSSDLSLTISNEADFFGFAKSYLSRSVPQPSAHWLSPRLRLLQRLAERPD